MCCAVANSKRAATPLEVHSSAVLLSMLLSRYVLYFRRGNGLRGRPFLNAGNEVQIKHEMLPNTKLAESVARGLPSSLAVRLHFSCIRASDFYFLSLMHTRAHAWFSFSRLILQFWLFIANHMKISAVRSNAQQFWPRTQDAYCLILS